MVYLFYMKIIVYVIKGLRRSHLIKCTEKSREKKKERNQEAVSFFV